MNKKDLERQITLEEFQTLTASLYLSLVAQVAVAIIMAIYLSDKISRLHFMVLCVTFASLIISYLIVGAFYHRDKIHQKNIQNHNRHMHFATLFLFVLGAFWSSIALSQLYAPLNQQVILIFILLGQSATSVLSLAPNMRLFYAGVPVSLLPLGIGFIWLNDQVHTILGVLLLLFFIFVCYLARTVNKLVTESIRLRLINETLLADKFQLLPSASHDLRQPLHASSLYISALEKNNDTNPEIITKIRCTIQSLQNSFDGLLNLSKLDANARKPKMQSVYWGDTKKQLQDEFNILSKQKIFIFIGKINMNIFDVNNTKKTNPNHYSVKKHHLKPAILRVFIINTRCITSPNTEKYRQGYTRSIVHLVYSKALINR
jgi:signal transduction histidine kinase